MAVLIVRKAAVEGGGGFSFNMTAGDFAAVAQGYSNGNSLPAFGSIDAQPISGHDLSFLISGGGGNAIEFIGDVTAQLAGLTVWVDGVEYPFDAVDWTYDIDNDLTTAGWNTAGPTFVNTSIYAVEIK